MNQTTTTPDSALPYRIDSTTAEIFRDHRLLKLLPSLAKESPEFWALVDSLTRDGLHEPLKITARHEFVDLDSRDRYLAARAAGLPNVPCQIVPDDAVATTFLQTLCHRRHFTKSALAYLAFPALQEALDECRERKLEMLKKGNVSPSCIKYTTGKTVEDYAETLGISRETFYLAKKVHEIFARDPEYAALMEPRILGVPIGGEHEEKRPVGLGAVIAGHAGRKNSTDGIALKGQLDLFTGGWDILRKRLVYWGDFTDDQKTTAVKSVVETISVMPGELREAILKEARRLAKQEQIAA